MVGMLFDTFEPDDCSVNRAVKLRERMTVDGLGAVLGARGAVCRCRRRRSFRLNLKNA